MSPFVEASRFNGMSFGLSHCGYDIRLDQDVKLLWARTTLASSMEEFNMPRYVMAVVHDKSSWARQGVFVNNTVIEPGWKGFLTLEIAYMPLVDGPVELTIPKGSPIAQIVFGNIDEAVDGYKGKYQNQARGPQEVIFE